AALLLCSIGLLGLVLSARMQRQQEQQLTERLHTKAILVRDLVRAAPAERMSSLQERMVALGREIHTRITLIDAAGKGLVDSAEEPAKMENHADRPEVQQAANAGWGSATRFSHTIGKTMMYVALRVEDPQLPVRYTRTAVPLDDLHEQLAALQVIIWTAA